jgi:hypothetical protein
MALFDFVLEFISITFRKPVGGWWWWLVAEHLWGKGMYLGM